MPCEGERQTAVARPPAQTDSKGVSAGKLPTVTAADRRDMHTTSGGAATTAPVAKTADAKDGNYQKQQAANAPEPLPEPTYQHHKTRDRIRRAKKQHRWVWLDSVLVALIVIYVSVIIISNSSSVLSPAAAVASGAPG